MSPIQRSWLVACTAGLLFAVQPLIAQENAAEKPRHEAVDGFVQHIYNLENAGLKDLSVILDTPLFRGNRLFEHIKVMIYCKAPGRHALDILGLPDETREVFLVQLKPLTTLTRYLFGLGSILIKVLHESEIEVTKEEDLFRIQAVPKTKALLQQFQKTVLWVGEDFRPVRIAQESEDLGNITVHLTTTKKEGKFLVASLHVKGVKGIEGEIRMKIEYKQIEKYWLPDSVTMFILKPEEETPPQDAAQTFHFKEYRLNKGLDDSLFKGSEKTPGEEEQDQGDESEY